MKCNVDQSLLKVNTASQNKQTSGTSSKLTEKGTYLTVLAVKITEKNTNFNLTKFKLVCCTLINCENVFPFTICF